ncbi:splicing factor 3B subunit 6-like [Sabethes cyaneus]|uniref:splicing factor 3B subunit 6-like n=1 Tax=Sabethes cyaneus TaxID=53552 RepID=UPI00237EDDDC|nr:splicing factor 3B subunit 6-like [Sabethes cyaneus]
MALAMKKRNNVRLPPEVNRVLYVRNLPYKITSDEMYDIFGKYGAIRQIRIGNTRGTAFVVYEDILDAKNACDHLSGLNVCNRYLVVLYYQSTKAFKRLDVDKKQKELDRMKAKYNINFDEYLICTLRNISLTCEHRGNRLSDAAPSCAQLSPLPYEAVSFVKI